MVDEEGLRNALLGAAAAQLIRRLPDGFELRVAPHLLDSEQLVVTVKRLSLPDEDGERRAVSHCRVTSWPRDLGLTISAAVSKLEP